VIRIESKTQNKIRDWNQNRIRDVGLRKAARETPRLLRILPIFNLNKKSERNVRALYWPALYTRHSQAKCYSFVTFYKLLVNLCTTSCKLCVQSMFIKHFTYISEQRQLVPHKTSTPTHYLHGLPPFSNYYNKLN
jgi:hypothetical protein